jgi:hypothetical protein
MPISLKEIHVQKPKTYFMKWMNLSQTSCNLLIAFLFTLCTFQSNGQREKNNGLLWEISGNGSKQPSYLFGTIHMICKEKFHLPEIVKQKFSASKQVYLEVDMDDPRFQGILMQQMQLPSNELLKNKFSKNDYNKLDTFFKKRNEHESCHVRPLQAHDGNKFADPTSDVMYRNGVLRNEFYKDGR